MKAKRLTALVLVVVLALVAAGCIERFFPEIGSGGAPPSPAPVPNSPTNVLLLFKWCWENRAIYEYEGIFTEDYRFAFAEGDSTGQSYTGWAATRDEDLHMTRGLFGAEASSNPPAQQITLYFAPNLIVMPDTRPGKDPKWHKDIRTSVDLTIDLGAETKRVTGYARFFVVRGDSALIPADVKDRVAADSTRWFIERWEDETLEGTYAVAAPPLEDSRARSASPMIVRLTRPVKDRTGRTSAASTAADGDVTWLSWGQLKHLYAYP